MKKIFTSIVMLVCGITMSAQIFTEKSVRDKFDDTIRKEIIKTIVIHDEEDAIITIEEKRRPLQVYNVLSWCEDLSAGNKDNIVNLVDNVYGYEDTWMVMNRADEKVQEKLLQKFREGKITSDELKEKGNKLLLFITHRVVVDRDSHEYQTEFWWIRDNDAKRIIYSKR